MALEVLYGVDMGLATERFVEISREVERRSGIALQAHKPVVGTNSFAHETGPVVAGVLKDPSTAEAYSPAAVGQRRSIVLGKQAGPASVRYRLGLLVGRVSDAVLPTLVAAVRRKRSTWASRGRRRPRTPGTEPVGGTIPRPTHVHGTPDLDAESARCPGGGPCDAGRERRSSPRTRSGDRSEGPVPSDDRVSRRGTDPTPDRWRPGDAPCPSGRRCWAGDRPELAHVAIAIRRPSVRMSRSGAGPDDLRRAARRALPARRVRLHRWGCRRRTDRCGESSGFQALFFRPRVLAGYRAQPGGGRSGPAVEHARITGPTGLRVWRACRGVGRGSRCGRRGHGFDCQCWHQRAVAGRGGVRRGAAMVPVVPDGRP